METNIKYLILGAGISGLTFANFLKTNDYMIIEKDSKVGGYCKTSKKGDFTWDYAGHFFHFKTSEMKSLFQNMMQDEEIITQDKNTKILYKDRYIDYPFQKNIHQLDKEEFIDCLYDLFNKKEKKEYNSFLDMLYAKFGESIVEKFLKPYNEKLYACDLNTLDKDAMGRFFPYADLEQIIKNMKESSNTSYNNTFLYPRNGAGSFLDKLAASLDQSRIKLRTAVKTIDVDNRIAILEDGQKIKYKYLINTAPLNQFLKMTGRKEDIELINELSYNKVLVFNLGFKKECDLKEHWIYLPEKKYNFYRLGFYNNILEEKKLSMYVEIGFSKNQEINIEEQLKKTLIGLDECNITKGNELEVYESIIMDPAYVHIEKETNVKLQNYMKTINAKSIYSIGRYGAWTYCSMEDSMISAKELAFELEQK